MVAAQLHERPLKPEESQQTERKKRPHLAKKRPSDFVFCTPQHRSKGAALEAQAITGGQEGATGSTEGWEQLFF